MLLLLLLLLLLKLLLDGASLLSVQCQPVWW
jgi:hypothetical protein